MKPSWDDAPEWAQWLAKDDDGKWFWYENKPVRVDGGWIVDYENPGRIKCAHEGSEHNYLESRP